MGAGGRIATYSDNGLISTVTASAAARSSGAATGTIFIADTTAYVVSTRKKRKKRKKRKEKRKKKKEKERKRTKRKKRHKRRDKYVEKEEISMQRDLRVRQEPFL